MPKRQVEIFEWKSNYRAVVGTLTANLQPVKFFGSTWEESWRSHITSKCNFFCLLCNFKFSIERPKWADPSVKDWKHWTFQVGESCFLLTDIIWAVLPHSFLSGGERQWQFKFWIAVALTELAGRSLTKSCVSSTSRSFACLERN